MGRAKLTDDRSADWPPFLSKLQTSSKRNIAKPILIGMHETGSEKKLANLVAENHVVEIVDNYDEQFAELLLSRDAHLYRANESVQRASVADHLKNHYKNKKPWKMGTWVYYPWSQQLVHVLEEELFNELRTVRNRELITASDQKKLASFRVACLGMSVGSSSALALSLSGMSLQLKLADGAMISGSNLNRVLAGVANVGEEKGFVIAKKIYEMNPYSEVHNLGRKLQQSNLAEIFDKPWPIDLVIDEIDDLEMKIRVRLEARNRGIPVIMATELADSVMLDIERFDQDKNRPLFHGLVEDIESILEKKHMTQREWMKYATRIIDPHNVPLDMQQSLLKIGSKVVTHPQLGSTAMITGGVLAFAAKRIALGRSVKSIRKSLSLDSVFAPELTKFKHRREHKKHTKVLLRSLDSI